ncbi:hypothetical protein CVT24_012711 [Panaeolus cyanescens]|uniref:Uncharacterized protein n=1 Tax=Panaeolus cyanescens TaxID=181874 RepID=A0A409YK63_9AGAR|nr:hypothetical protein CVT24_012711 [Panaeolus cyanescens]
MKHNRQGTNTSPHFLPSDHQTPPTTHITDTFSTAMFGDWVKLVNTNINIVEGNRIEDSTFVRLGEVDHVSNIAGTNINVKRNAPTTEAIPVPDAFPASNDEAGGLDADQDMRGIASNDPDCSSPPIVPDAVPNAEKAEEEMFVLKAGNTVLTAPKANVVEMSATNAALITALFKEVFPDDNRTNTAIQRDFAASKADPEKRP